MKKIILFSVSFFIFTSCFSFVRSIQRNIENKQRDKEIKEHVERKKVDRYCQK